MTDNDPDLNGKYLGTITQDFVRVADTLREASYQLRKRSISTHPIFPISKVPQPIGQLLLGRQEMGTDWHYYLSFLDEFRQRQLIGPDRLENFRAIYKDADEFCCLFVIDETFTNFVFVPYPEDN